MPAINTSASITINAPAGQVGQAVADFNTWPIWSPWLILEREAKVNVHGSPGEVGHGYDWQGDQTGSGEMKITSLTDNRMETDLTFLKPFKSKAKVAMDINAKGQNESEVVWHMDSSLPFFMFFMTKKMTAMIRSDYERGLGMLKDYVETGSVNSEVLVEGVVEVPATRYAGRMASSSMADVGDSMAAEFPSVFKSIEDAKVQMTGAAFAIYNKMDLVDARCDYTACIPIADTGAPLGDGVEIENREACKALKLVHTGPYRHLGNAWSKGMGDMRHKKIKASKQAPFEIYVNDPAVTPEDSLITEVYIPVRDTEDVG